MSRTASIHSKSRPSSVASYQSFQKNNNSCCESESSGEGFPVRRHPRYKEVYQLLILSKIRLVAHQYFPINIDSKIFTVFNRFIANFLISIWLNLAKYLQSRSTFSSPARPGRGGEVGRVGPPVPVRTSSLDRGPGGEHPPPTPPTLWTANQKFSFYRSPAEFDDSKTPTNENVDLLSNINNNNYAVPRVPRGRTINVNQLELPPPSYDQITWGWSTQYQEFPGTAWSFKTEQKTLSFSIWLYLHVKHPPVSTLNVSRDKCDSLLSILNILIFLVLLLTPPNRVVMQ